MVLNFTKNSSLVTSVIINCAMSSSGENRGIFKSDGLISRALKSVVDLMGLMEGSPPSGGRMLRKFGEVVVRPDRGFDADGVVHIENP